MTDHVPPMIEAAMNAAEDSARWAKGIVSKLDPVDADLIRGVAYAAARECDSLVAAIDKAFPQKDGR